MSDWIKDMKDDVDRKMRNELKKQEFIKKQKEDEEVFKKQERILIEKRYANKIKEIHTFLEHQCEELRNSGDSRAIIKVREGTIWGYGIHVAGYHNTIDIIFKSNGIFKVRCFREFGFNHKSAKKTLYVPVFLLTNHRMNTWLKWIVYDKKFLPPSTSEKIIWLILLLISIMTSLSLLPEIIWVFITICSLIMLLTKLSKNNLFLP